MKKTILGFGMILVALTLVSMVSARPIPPSDMFVAIPALLVISGVLILFWRGQAAPTTIEPAAETTSSEEGPSESHVRICPADARPRRGKSEWSLAWICAASALLGPFVVGFGEENMSVETYGIILSSLGYLGALVGACLASRKLIHARPLSFLLVIPAIMFTGMMIPGLFRSSEGSVSSTMHQLYSEFSSRSMPEAQRIPELTELPALLRTAVKSVKPGGVTEYQFQRHGYDFLVRVSPAAGSDMPNFTCTAIGRGRHSRKHNFFIDQTGILRASPRASVPGATCAEYDRDAR